jgi:hypothetical protein
MAITSSNVGAQLIGTTLDASAFQMVSEKFLQSSTFSGQKCLAYSSQETICLVAQHKENIALEGDGTLESLAMTLLLSNLSIRIATHRNP